MIWKTLLVGLGNIGFNYDNGGIRGGPILSHFHAIKANPNFELICCVDINVNKLTNEIGNVPVFNNLTQAHETSKYDLVIVATPTNTHTDIVREITKFRPKVILCEKPFGLDYIDSKNCFDMICKNEIYLVINYIRCFEPGVHELFKILEKNIYESNLLTGNVAYTGGLYNSASHMVNMLQMLIGYPDEINVLSKGSYRNNDFYGVDFRLRFNNAWVYFQSINESQYSSIELKMNFSNFCLKYLNNGRNIHIHKATDDPLFRDNIYIDPIPEVLTNDFNNYQKYVLQHIDEYLLNKVTVQSDHINALHTLKILNKIRTV